MENKEKRKVSILTVFIWLALIVTMSVVVISGINRSNALEENKNITLKLDLTDIIKKEGLVEQEEINTFLNEYSSNIGTTSNNYTAYGNNSEVTYVGSDEETIGIYNIEIIDESKYIRICNNEYEFLNDNEVLEKFTQSQKIYHYQELSENIEEYNLVARKKESRIVTIKIDFKDYIEGKGLTERNDIEKFLENYSSRICGRFNNNGIINFINLNTKYIGSEKSTIGIYETEITNDIIYLQINKPYDFEYQEISLSNKYSMLYNEKLLEIVGELFDGCIYYGNSYYVNVLKIIEGIEEYDISIEKNEELTIGLEGVDYCCNSLKRVIYIIDKTNNLKFKPTMYSGNYCKIYISPKFEYDIIFPKKGNEDEDLHNIIYNDVILKEFDKDNYYKKINPGEIIGEYTFKVVENDIEYFSSVNWEDDKKATLKLEAEIPNYKDREKNIIFTEKIDKNFKISNEYENDTKWLIVNESDIKNDKLPYEYDGIYDKYVPEYILANFIEDVEEVESAKALYFKKDRYNIYIKDKNMLYSLIPLNDLDFASQNVNLEFIGDSFSSNRLFEFESGGILYLLFPNSGNYYYTRHIGIENYKTEIKAIEEEKTSIVVNKIINEGEENKTYYVGLFENDIDKITDRVYNLNIEDGTGSIAIEVEDYDVNKEYYIYEVDENGNKIENEDVIYSKNKVLDRKNIIKKKKILSDGGIISSNRQIVYNYRFDNLNNLIFNNLEEQIDNNIVMTNVNEDIVTISSRGLHMVKYETEKHGNLEGDTKEAVEHGEKPVNVPDILPNEGYEFEKWVVIKNGEEIEVIPSEYVILEDTTFIAKYRKIEIVIPLDTSDINIWLYVGITIISVIFIVIAIIIITISRKSRK